MQLNIPLWFNHSTAWQSNTSIRLGYLYRTLSPQPLTSSANSENYTAAKAYPLALLCQT